MPLAVERLVGEGGAAKVLTYFQAIGRGDPWEAAFAAAFGKSVDAFYAEFASVPQRIVIALSAHVAAAFTRQPAAAIRRCRRRSRGCGRRRS